MSQEKYVLANIDKTEKTKNNNNRVSGFRVEFKLQDPNELRVEIYVDTLISTIDRIKIYALSDIKIAKQCTSLSELNEYLAANNLKLFQNDTVDLTYFENETKIGILARTLAARKPSVQETKYIEELIRVAIDKVELDYQDIDGLNIECSICFEDINLKDINSCMFCKSCFARYHSHCILEHIDRNLRGGKCPACDTSGKWWYNGLCVANVAGKKFLRERKQQRAQTAGYRRYVRSRKTTCRARRRKSMRRRRRKY